MEFLRLFLVGKSVKMDVIFHSCFSAGGHPVRYKNSQRSLLAASIHHSGTRYCYRRVLAPSREENPPLQQWYPTSNARHAPDINILCMHVRASGHTGIGDCMCVRTECGERPCTGTLRGGGGESSRRLPVHVFAAFLTHLAQY